MKPQTKQQLETSFKLAIQKAENEIEKRKLIKAADGLGIKIDDPCT